MIAEFIQKERVVPLGMLKPGDTFSSSNSVFMIITKDGLKEELPDCIPYICLSSASPERTKIGKIYSVFGNVCATPKVFKLVEISKTGEHLALHHNPNTPTQTIGFDDGEVESEIGLSEIGSTENDDGEDEDDEDDEDNENEPEKFDEGMR